MATCPPPRKDERYEKDGAFILKCLDNEIRIWSLAIDVRTSEQPTAELPARGLNLLQGDQVLFHYTNREAVEVKATRFDP